MAQNVTQARVRAGLHIEGVESALGQAVVEAGLDSSSNPRASQVILEVGKDEATIIRASQTIIEVILRRNPAYYTDGAAACNFTY